VQGLRTPVQACGRVSEREKGLREGVLGTQGVGATRVISDSSVQCTSCERHISPGYLRLDNLVQGLRMPLQACGSVGEGEKGVRERVLGTQGVGATRVISGSRVQCTSCERHISPGYLRLDNLVHGLRMPLQACGSVGGREKGV
jgi:hypothetical protein